jgi:hypothetical protein
MTGHTANILGAGALWAGARVRQVQRGEWQAVVVVKGITNAH